MKYTSLRNKSVNSQKTSQSILFMCRAKFGTNQLKSLKTPVVYHLHGKPIRFEIVLMVSKISDRKSIRIMRFPVRVTDRKALKY